jgi:hypothetical protein
MSWMGFRLIRRGEGAVAGSGHGAFQISPHFWNLIVCCLESTKRSARFVGIFTTVRNLGSRWQKGYKPFSGGINVQYVSQFPDYSAGFAVCITFGFNMIPTYNQPLDVYKKLFREARRAWLAQNTTDTSDHLFNFCVTCVALRDWVVKHLNFDNCQKDKYQKEWRRIGYFGACADIANKSKHFALDYGKTSSVTNISEYTEQLVAIGADGEKIEGLTFDKPFFKISLGEGQEIDLLILLFNVCKDWENQFQLLIITKEKLPEILDIFVEYH